MDDALRNGEKCPICSCKGKLVHCKVLKTTYKWAFPMKCDTCNIARYMCQLCFLSPGTARLGNKSIFVRSEIWKHNHRHLKRGDLDSNLGSAASTIKNDDTVLEEILDKYSVENVNVGITLTGEEKIYFLPRIRR